MRSATTRLFILLSAILIAVIIATQVHWLSKTYAYEKNEFNTSVLKSIRGVYEDMPLLYDSKIPIDSLVEQYRESGFIFQVHAIPNHDSLLSNLSAELEDFKVFTDCKVAVYNKSTKQYDYAFHISNDARRKSRDTITKLPILKRNFDYVHLFFPNRGKYLVSQMQNWIFASVILLVLLVGFAFSLYYFFKQKFLVEVQKDFINNVTHEFSTPLSVIEIAVDGLQKPSTNDQAQRQEKYAEAIKYQTAYLKSHIANLVRTVMAGNYHFSINQKEIVPNELLKKAVAQLDTLLEKNGGSINWELEKNNTVLIADEENLYLAFFNIINNAIKYSTQPRITIGTMVKQGKYEIRIRDNGIGIAASEQRKIFKKFYRVHTGNVHAVKGLGLGLYFTQRVIRGHGGSIHVNSRPDQGTEFLIELPLKH